MPVGWLSEAMDQPLDPETGVFSVRLTAAARHSVNSYCEQPYTSPDGKRIVIMRSAEADPRLPPFDLLVADVETYKIIPVEKDAQSYHVGTAAWSGWIYYVNQAGELMRVNLMSLDKEVIWPRWPFPREFTLDSVTADFRYMVGSQFTPNHTTQIVRIDLEERTSKIIYEHDEQLGHVQCEPLPGRNDVLVQLNRGRGRNHMWDTIPRETPHPGTTHFIIDIEGQNRRPLAIGAPYTLSSAGHSAWIADTGRIAVATHFNLETWRPEPHLGGNLFVVGPEDKSPRAIPAAEHVFNHVSVSRCGRYFVCDSYGKKIPGPIALVVGNLETGRYRTLLSDCRASGGGPACGHPHAYFTADNKRVIYNADPYWIGQVFAATVPDGFLESLD